MKKILITLCIFILSLSLNGCMFFGIASPFSALFSVNTDETFETASEIEEWDFTTEQITTTEIETTTIATSKAYTTLEEYYTSPAKQEQMKSEERFILSQYKDVYSNVQFIFHGNTITYVYTYRVEADVESTNEALEESFKTIDLTKDFENIEQETGISDITLEFVYKNRNDTEIFRKSFTR